MQQVQKLEPHTLPLQGRRLIEASAGTGKTYTISGLYLRLLLGHGGVTPLTCEQILVVTFTNAATQELRDRVRNRIRLAYHAFLGLECNDEFINKLYNETEPSQRKISLRRLDLALKSMDEASIFTIHGFCQRVLTDMAFESALLFESEFTLDDSDYLHHAVRDYWRQACYPLAPTLAQIIAKEFKEPEQLLKQLRSLLGSVDSQPLTDPGSFDEVTSKLSQQLTVFRQDWNSQSTTTLKLLMALPLNGTRFGKKADDFPKLQAMFENISQWAKHGNGLPPAGDMEKIKLSDLRLNKGGQAPTDSEAPLLAEVDSILDLIQNIKPAFLYQALQDVRSRFTKQKQQKNVLTPDDLLSSLSNAITANSQSLPQAIKERFPIALIDEFQDTDPLQFQIFSSIYPENQGSGLLMIGDPKQAIYAFRGADIFTYLNAKNQTENHYSLATNYRSAEQMVNGVNQLFSNNKKPFTNDSIPFELVNTPSSAKNKTVHVEGDAKALQIRLLPEDSLKGLNKETARKHLANDAAAEIVRLLNKKALLGDKPLQAKDIAVLVRDRNEAAVIKQALTDRGVGAVFLSRDSVFDCIEARELAIILRSLQAPKDEKLLRNALATYLLGYSAEQIHQFNHDETHRQNLLEMFYDLQQTWIKRGIMPALMQLAQHTQLIQRLLLVKGGERKLTDFRHLCELLQQKATELDGSSALVAWYEQHLISHSEGEEQQLRLESERNLVQIVTIHKSKGLEYPICFIPFISLARLNRKPNPMVYHNDEKLVWDIEQTDEGWEQQRKETLAEDLRLLYVALTRPVYRCYLSIANHCKVTKSKGQTSQLCETAIGYLLNITEANTDITLIEQQANKLKSDAISVTTIDPVDIKQEEVNLESGTNKTYKAKPLNRIITTPWKVGSYSGLVKHSAHEQLFPGADDEGTDIVEGFNSTPIKLDVISPMTRLNRFNFEKGANAGSFLHNVLENIDFTNAKHDLEEHLPTLMERYGIEAQWHEMLMEWFLDLLGAPMNQEGLSLYKIPNHKRLVEMEFYLPITKLKATKLNKALQDFGYSDRLAFDDLKGMLKGFVDLIFEFEGKFYIADYKSNHLGDDFICYEIRQMYQAMTDHRYDLQFILYTVALHRYLKQRLPDYQYDTHMGGSYYLFLRGMSANEPSKGVYYDLPPLALIERLDNLFSGNDFINQEAQS
ncbi:exodeoxyribonuclease V subunit beta [Parashewanella curva]|uniref:RecBCD enzyme subunit RecB n=1 Tax=Parashewanella curva TaxID=2338552 RepID=A0A3L8PX15_9GAMM|nr:exodeoxyribonuclease V subunit beta [Parashewanella curva]RLV58988.1 exodeoxyribonuclease V subunit beta [Parashewanella curva]